MHLSRLHIRNFRGIGRLDLDLGPTTVIIGENNCGKTSVLDAIAISLGPACSGEACPFNALDYHRALRDGVPAPEPITITVELAEQSRDEWSEAVVRAFEPVIRRLQDGRAVVRLRIASTPDGERFERRFVESDAQPIPGVDHDTLARELARWVRVFQLDAHRILASGFSETSDPEEEEAARVRRARFQALYESLVEPSARTPVLDQELQRTAALLNLPPEVVREERRSERIAELLLGQIDTAGSVLDPDLPVGRLGTGMQALMLLLLLGSMLRMPGLDEAAPGAGSIVAIEDPEAHLHPRVLASLWRVIESMRAQRIVVTHSGDFLAAVPIESIRVLRRHGATIHAYRLGPNRLSNDEIRRVAYHVVNRRGSLLFARAWFLVEGETEYWLLPEMARLCGFDFASEGVAVVEFAQSGLMPLIHAAESLGIKWHVLAEGDQAGLRYTAAMRGFDTGRVDPDRVTQMTDPDVEHLLWRSGYDFVYRGAAYGSGSARRPRRSERATQVIRRAVINSSKPRLAIAVLEAAEAPGSPGVPDELRDAIQAVVRLARRSGAVRDRKSTSDRNHVT